MTKLKVTDKRPQYALAKPITAVPLGEHVLLRRVEQAQTGAIVIADIAKEKPLRCEVIGVGSAAAVEVKAGDFVLIQRYSGNEVEVEGELLTIIHASDILLRL